MNSLISPGNPEGSAGLHVKRAKFAVRLLQVLFVVVALHHIDGPFLSAHNERQNQTFDISRHVFRDGWSAVAIPKASFSSAGGETQRYTAMLLEVPFHGLLGWPAAKLFGHERAVVRLVSVMFAVVSIELLFLILRFWVAPTAAAIGAALWALAPLVLQFGQVPMPDIICTTGILASFLFALRGNLPASSGFFLFALLAKSNIIVFGLPILIALLVSRNCRTVRDFFRLSLLWGLPPLCALVAWMAMLESFGPPTPMSAWKVLTERGDWKVLLNLNLYLRSASSLLLFGFGVIGALGCLFALRGRRAGVHPYVQWAIVISSIGYFVFIVRKVPEPQYSLPLLAWCIIPACVGLQVALAGLRGRILRPAVIAAAVGMHLLVALIFTCDLKASRVPDFKDIETAARLLPADARVLMGYRYYGAGPAVWLDRNVLQFTNLEELQLALVRVRDLGFNYLMLLDIESRHSVGLAAPNGEFGFIESLTARIQKFLRTSGDHGKALANYTDPALPLRKFCDEKFSVIYSGPHLVLYALPVQPVSR